jgi:hypothetical protein
VQRTISTRILRKIAQRQKEGALAEREDKAADAQNQRRRGQGKRDQPAFEKHPAVAPNRAPIEMEIDQAKPNDAR